MTFRTFRDVPTVKYQVITPTRGDLHFITVRALRDKRAQDERAATKAARKFGPDAIVHALS